MIFLSSNIFNSPKNKIAYLITTKLNNNKFQLMPK